MADSIPPRDEPYAVTSFSFRLDPHGALSLARGGCPCVPRPPGGRAVSVRRTAAKPSRRAPCCTIGGPSGRSEGASARRARVVFLAASGPPSLGGRAGGRRTRVAPSAASLVVRAPGPIASAPRSGRKTRPGRLGTTASPAARRGIGAETGSVGAAPRQGQSGRAGEGPEIR